MFEVNSDVLILGVGLIIGLFILKLLGRFMFRVVGFIILLSLGTVYAYFFTDFFENNKDNAVVQKVGDKLSMMSVIQYQEEVCMKGPKNRNDSLTCECIVAPIVDDLKTKYTGDEIAEMVKDKPRYMKEIMSSLRRNQEQIIDNLKRRNAVHLWNNMIINMKKGKFIGEY